MSKSLYRLTEEFRDFEDKLENPLADVSETWIKEILADIKVEIESKVENIGKVILSNKADIASLDTEIKRLNERKKAAENTIDWLRTYLLTEMTTTGINKVKSDILTVYINTAQATVEIDALDLIPAEYIRHIDYYEPEKKLIKEQFEKTGEIIPGTRIMPGKKYVVIR